MLYEGILSLFPYVSLVAPGKLQCALLLALAAPWVSAERHPWRVSGQRRAKSRRSGKEGRRRQRRPCPLPPRAPVQTGLHGAAAAVVGKLVH